MPWALCRLTCLVDADPQPRHLDQVGEMKWDGGVGKGQDGSGCRGGAVSDGAWRTTCVCEGNIRRWMEDAKEEEEGWITV